MIDKKIEITVAGYTVDLAPVLNAVINFVKALLDTYLPADVKDAADKIEG